MQRYTSWSRRGVASQQLTFDGGWNFDFVRLEGVAEFLFISFIDSVVISDRRTSQFLTVIFRQDFFFAASLGG